MIRLLIVVIIAAMMTACGRDFETPSIDETGHESAEEIPPGEPDPNGTEDDASQKSGTRLSLNQAMSLRYAKNGILELKFEIPAGSVILIPDNYEVQNLDYRKSDGTIERSSTGFVAHITFVSVPAASKPQFPDSKIAEANKVSGGLYISASVIGYMDGIEGDFDIIKGAAPGEEFLKVYEASGKPKFSYTSSVKKRFEDKLNKGINPATQPANVRAKWQRIYNELKRAGDRKVATPKSILMIEKAEAVQRSIDFENKGVISPNGAWSIAVEGTAPRHGFGNVPCAEFQSELIRQAYKRAGYDVTADFNANKGNRLYWTDSAAVVNLSNNLYKAGWIPWDSTVYRPMTGAILMHGSGKSPGHTYMSGGDDGRIIVDNGAPQGRDLRKTKQKTIDLMFRTGVFFLPPGINPAKW